MSSPARRSSIASTSGGKLLLCRDEVPLQRQVPPERVFDMYVASSAEPEDPQLDIRSFDRTVFRRPGSTLSTNEPLVKAAMVHLREAWPRFVSFGDLLAGARARLNPGYSVLNAERDAQEQRTLAGPLIRCYSTTHVDLTAFPFRYALDVGAKPVASRPAQYQAQGPSSVTNLWHETVGLTDLERHLVRHLDGSLDHAGLVDLLVQEVNCGRLVIQDQGRAVSDGQHVREILQRILADNLATTARKGLLVR